MLNGSSLDAIVEKHRPAIIIPEVEAIKTERFYEYESRGIQVVPSAKAANYTMNRRAIRDLAARDLGIKTAPYQYADSLQALKAAVNEIGFPCLVKPLMSSSGKGQSTLYGEEDIENAWEAAIKGSRGDLIEVIVEGFIQFNLEITLLTVTTNDGDILFCPPIGHRQERGDYQESWQPAQVKPAQLEEAKAISKAVTSALGGAGIWGVEFFIADDAVYFSEVSPRPHDTGMVTLAGTQNLDEFELHTRAVLGLPIHEISLIKPGASAVILASQIGSNPVACGLVEALSMPNSMVRIFGKPSTRPFRRMGVSLYSSHSETEEEIREKAAIIAAQVVIA
jgi:phosphoribosylglycinamide formyltransferase 2